MKTILFTFAATVLMGQALWAHDSDAYTTLIPEKSTPASAVKESTDAAMISTDAQADRSALKLIDDLTEKVYLARKKRWEKEREAIEANN